MIAALREIRLSRFQFAIVAAISGVATALIIATALGQTAAQTAAIAALRHRPVIVQSAAVTARPSASFASDVGAGAAPSAAAGAGSGSPPSIPTTPSSSAPTSPSSSGSGASGSGAAPATTTTTTTTTTSSTTTAAPAHKVKHVFLIALSTSSFEATFGRQSVARYLNGTLRPKGTLLGGYETLGRSELPDYLAILSGQAPNTDTRGDCATYAEFPSNTNPAADGQVPGEGCVYPNTIITLADQVNSSAHSWKAYIEDMGTTSCVHPNSDAPDDAPLPFAGAQYATRHNPFIYFHSLLDLGGCASDDVSLDHLGKDLRSLSDTPTLSFLAPRACDDASATSCPDGKPAGLAGGDAFLRTWVPRILASAAYKKDGVLIITFALAAPATSPPGSGPPTSGAPTGSGGPVPTGALVISRYATAGKTIANTYNPYSVLRSIEDLLGYKLLAHAKSAKPFTTTALPGA